MSGIYVLVRLFSALWARNLFSNIAYTGIQFNNNFFSKWQIIETDYFFEGHTPNHFLFRKNQDKQFLKKTIPSGSPMKIKCFVPNRIRHTLKLNTERCKTKTKKSRSLLSCPLTCLMKM